MKINVTSKVSNLRYLNNLFIENELKKHGIEDLHTSHGSIIHTLYAEGPLTMKDLAKAINRDKSTLTVLVRKLIKNGYIVTVQSEKDARVKFVELTEKAKKIEDAFYQVSNDLNSTLWNGIEDEESKVFIKVIDKMINNLKVG